MGKKPGMLGFDPKDGVQLRTYLESLRAHMVGERSTWDSHWDDLAGFFAPRTSRFSYDEANRGARKDVNIINETGILALRTLKAGMLTGMSSPTRAWFKLGCDDEECEEDNAVRAWLDECEESVRKVFLDSNVYQTLLNSYGEEGLFGTTVFLVLEDPDTVIRCHPYPLGSYYLGVDESLRVDLCVRVLTMTVRQMVERFGFDNVSESMQALYQSPAGGVKEDRYPVVNAIMETDYFGDNAFGTPSYPYTSIWYEMGAYNARKGILRRSGYYDCPFICGRWSVVGENVYGESAAMDCLGSVMSLQAWEERTAQAAEKGIDPVILVSSEIDPRRVSTLPGDFIFADTRDISNVMKPAYEVNFKPESGIQFIQRLEARINDAMYRSLFQMFSESDRRDITAEEIRARQQEKMQVLGPVVERNVEEVLAPLVKRTIHIMERQGKLPPMPAQLRDKKLTLRFVSILAAAQKIAEVTNLNQFMAFLGNEVAVDQGILDNVDLDKVAQEYAELSDVPAEILRSPEDIAKIRQDRAKQQQQQQAAENAQKLAVAAKNMSGAQLGTGSVLDKALPALAGGEE